MRHLYSTVLTTLFLSTLLWISGCIPTGEDVAVDTIYGTIIGKEEGGLQRFLGIPYAKPPTGMLRWQAPEPPSHWDGTRRAFRQARACVQTGSPTGAFGSQEDCLYLNVWTPSTPGPHPVMAWIHGGGLVIGSANEAQYDGATLAKAQDVVVVSMNYRLGYMGFLSLPQFANTPTHSITGNQGFLDQIAALQWVQDNITQFGGNPDNVTVFGESAGAISTCLLLASPLTNNLMNKAIMQSGACNTFKTSSKAEAETLGLKFLQNIGCDNTNNPAACALSKPIDQIELALGIPPNELFRENFEDWVFPPSPALDGHFLPDYPAELLEQSSKNVPVIIGVNKDEGTLFVGIKEHPTDEAGYLENLEKYYNGRSTEIAAIYPLDSFSPSGAAMAQIVTDAAMTCPSRDVANIWDATDHDVYYYQFTQDVSAPLMGILELFFTENAAPLGTFHAAEIPYVFGLDGVLGEAVTSHQLQTRAAIMQYWGNFARTGNPNDNELSHWPLYTAETQQHLQLDQSVEVAAYLRQSYCEYWWNNPANF